MQIIIPMSGEGRRFERAGYEMPKPLIEVDGKPMIAHVIDLFPGETDFIFLCRESHLANTQWQMARTIGHYCPTGQIVSISDDVTEGPVAAILAAADRISDTSPVVVNYCDFSCYWQWERFKAWTQTTQCDGAIPAYHGFHPHSLGSTYYAYLKTTDARVTDIQEKQPWTDRPMDEYASSGTYYFRTGALMKSACQQMVAQGLKTQQEYYVSLAYKPLLAQKKHIQVYPLQHFMQWGTPEDLETYQQYSSAFKALTEPHKKAHQEGVVCIPMAGFGSRFKVAGFQTPKPLLPVSGKPMVIQALADLPKAKTQRLILREEAQDIQHWIKSVETVVLDAPTQGQASTVLEGFKGINPDLPITIGACDSGALYDGEKFEQLMKNPGIDVIVWAARGHIGAKQRPHQFGWIDAEGGIIDKVSVKVPLKNPARDPIVTGTFTFKRASDARRAIENMIQREAKVHGEYYLDMAINDAVALGLRCALFEVEHYLGWGTPEEWQTFEYWQSCFHLWPSHPYRLEDDPHISQDALSNVAQGVANWEGAIVD